MSSSLRQRRASAVSSSNSSANAPIGEGNDAAEVAPPLQPGNEVSFGAAFFILLLCRYFSARANIVHDCDEVFNYWEPLHYIVHKSGFQTWEYSSEFSLRSYLYLLLHALVAAPASLYYGTSLGKVNAFYVLRFALGMASAFTEAAFVHAISRRFGKRVATYTITLLCFSSGCYTASTTFLPSTFSMYALTYASAALLYDRLELSVIAASIGVLVGWPFSGLAVAPIVLYGLRSKFASVFLAGFTSSIATLAISAVADRYFYGRWKLSILNLIVYNVVGGGDSILYGVEEPLFYIRNALNNFNLALVLALVLPLIILFAWRVVDKQLLLVVSPLFLWLGFMSLQPHKEERFLYPIYPLICLAAASSIERLPDLLLKPLSNSDMGDYLRTALKILRPTVLSLILIISYSRTTSLLEGYSAPMKIYQYLPAHPESSQTVCVGSEWHRFPSSFFLHSPKYEVKWIDDGFTGLLPIPFNSSLGGTHAAPRYFNNRNQAAPEQFLKDESKCDFLVELALGRPGVSYRGDDNRTWEVVAELAFLDNERSPALTRAFFIPWKWYSSNKFGSYRLLKKRLRDTTSDV